MLTNKLQSSKNNRQSGFVALISTIIISAVVLLLIVGAFTISTIEIDKSKAKYNSENAFAWANLCAEEALQEIRENSEYTATDTTYGNINASGCSFSVSGDWVGGKIIQSTGTFSDHTRRIKIVVIDYNPKLVIDSWEEVTEF